MNKLLLLLKIQMIHFFRLNSMSVNGNKKERRRVAIFVLSIFLVIFLIEIYMFSSIYGWMSIGLTSHIPAILVCLVSMICFVLTFIKNNSLLFGFKDFDLLISFPISSHLFVLSRYLFGYMINLSITCLTFFIPMTFFWTQESFSVVSVVITLIMTIFIPIIPMISALLISLLLSYVASYFRYANFFTILFNILLISLIMFGSLYLNSIQANDFSKLVEIVTKLVSQNYPLAILVQSAIIQHNIFDFMLVVLISFIYGLLFILIVSHWYLSLNTRFLTKKNASLFRWRPSKINKPLLALYKREWLLYFSSPLYVINTSFGSIALLVTSICLLIFPMEKLEFILNISDLSNLIQSYLVLVPFMISLVLSLSSTTASSISIEGKSRWQLLVLPIPLTIVYQAKLLLQLTISFPVILVSSFCLTFSLSLPKIWILLLILFPTAYTIFSALAGLLINCLYPIFNWTSEQQIVKQSFAIFLSLFSTIFTLGIGIASIFFFPFSKLAGLILLSFLLFLGSFILYKKICKNNPFLF